MELWACGPKGVGSRCSVERSDRHRQAGVVDVPTYPYENCYPMIPAGGCNHEMILEDPPELKKKTGRRASPR